MNQRERRVIEHMRDAHAMEDLYALGHTPDEVKAGLLTLLAPYSQNSAALHSYVIEYMVADAIALTTIMDSPWAMRLFEEALRVHHAALATNRDSSLRTISRGLVDEGAALSVYWSQYHLSHDLATLALEEFVHESLRLIGTFVEGILKPYLYELAHLVQIGRGQQPSVEDVKRLTLGNVVDILISVAPTSAHYAIRGIKLNQWRNIAQHFTAQARGDSIVLGYNDDRTQVRLTRNELSDVVYDVASAHKAIKVAHAIVFFDHLDELRAGGMLPHPALRPEASFVVLMSALASQGFRVIDAAFTEEHSQLTVQDFSCLDPAERRFHSTQFVLGLFFQHRAERVTVEYRERDGAPSFRTSASRELIERAELAGDLSIVAREAEITDLKGRP